MFWRGRRNGSGKGSKKCSSQTGDEKNAATVTGAVAKAVPENAAASTLPVAKAAVATETEAAVLAATCISASPPSPSLPPATSCSSSSSLAPASARGAETTAETTAAAPAEPQSMPSPSSLHAPSPSSHLPLAPPSPVQYLVTRWAQTPFSYGSYSYMGTGESRCEDREEMKRDEAR